MNNENNVEKIVIIGGGPAGLSAAVYASRSMLNPLVVEGATPGGQLTLTSEVENYPGFPNGVLGTELIKNIRTQAEKFGTRFITDNVITVKKESDLFNLTLTNGNIIKSQSVLVATGADAKWLGLESEQRLRGKGVSACATCDGFFFKDKVIAVVGGGDSAMEEALFLTKFASRVYVIHRRSEFKASKIMQERVLNNEKIGVVWNKEVTEVLGENKVEGVKLKDTQDGTETTLELEGLFLAIGHTPSTAFLKETGVLIDDKGYIYTSDRVFMEDKADIQGQYNKTFRYMTNIPGLFAAGDCTDFVYRQAGTAVGMAIAAEIEVEKYLEDK
ncbi:MAG TPA: thioredoxin-disulfide reductase [Candidatus Dojkabacteria bacterium]|nr:thioredoxin-disulfide reductase [Candidatus Dojkabacteria bacterium]